MAVGDVNIASVESADVTNAGMYLFYAMLAALAGLASLIILVAVLSVLIAKIGFGNIMKFK